MAISICTSDQVRVFGVVCGALLNVKTTLKQLINQEGGSENYREEGIFVFYGDILLSQEDLQGFKKEIQKGLSQNRETLFALLSPLGRESAGDYICCDAEQGQIKRVWGHPRDEGTHRFCGLYLPSGFRKYIETCGELFHDVEVGMMPPVEQHLEIGVSDFIKDGGTVLYSETVFPAIDLDKPWHILMANAHICHTLTSTLKENSLAEGASIDKTARISGFVQLGKNSRIGHNVIPNLIDS